jgi:hypothetical protein
LYFFKNCVSRHMTENSRCHLIGYRQMGRQTEWVLLLDGADALAVVADGLLFIFLISKCPQKICVLTIVLWSGESVLTVAAILETMYRYHLPASSSRDISSSQPKSSPEVQISQRIVVNSSLLLNSSLRQRAFVCWRLAYRIVETSLSEVLGYRLGFLPCCWSFHRVSPSLRVMEAMVILSFK